MSWIWRFSKSASLYCGRASSVLCVQCANHKTDIDLDKNRSNITILHFIDSLLSDSHIEISLYVLYHPHTPLCRDDEIFTLQMTASGRSYPWTDG